MFHRRHAERTAQIWLQRLKDSTSTKRLSLVYLANEVTQQSKARHRPDFGYLRAWDSGGDRSAHARRGAI
ncbi:UPF0400 protein like [Verticillium longisporum]|nr:UPF0400 protein like [Verticillium longisporum]